MIDVAVKKPPQTQSKHIGQVRAWLKSFYVDPFLVAPCKSILLALTALELPVLKPSISNIIFSIQ